MTSHDGAPAYGPDAPAPDLPRPGLDGPDLPGSGLDGPDAPVRPEPSAWRLVAGAAAHGVWLGPAVAALMQAVLLPFVPAFGFLLLVDGYLVPVIVLVAVLAAVAAALAAVNGPDPRRTRSRQSVAASCATVASVAVVAGLLNGSQPGVVLAAVLVVGGPAAFAGGVVGLVAVGLAAPWARPRRGWVDPHAAALGLVAAAVLVSAAALIEARSSPRSLLASVCPAGTVAQAERSWPAQRWCTAPGGEVTRLVADSAVGAEVVLLCAAVAALVLGIVWRTVRARRPAVTAAVAVAVTVAVPVTAWVWASAVAVPPASERFTALPDPWTSSGPDDAAAPPSEPAPPPTATPSTVPAPPAAAVRSRLDTLSALALDAAGPVLWPQALAVTEAPCTTTDGLPGTSATLTGRFTTRDLATAKDNVDFLFITQDNEKVAADIVEAWRADGGLGEPEPMKGEWYQGSLTEDGLDVAHVGFAEGVGDIRVTTDCAVP